MTDVILATVCLIVALPVILPTGLLVALSSPGPILFKQQRVGRGGALFTMLKFRSMRPGAYDRVCHDPALWAEYVANDYKLTGGNAEITKVGSMLRKLSLDELPQLWNVLRGDMSMVGVRPLVLPEFEERPERTRQLYALLRPGITGLWQVEGRWTAVGVGRIELEDAYISRWRFTRDLGLLARTPWALLKPHIHRAQHSSSPEARRAETVFGEIADPPG